MESLVQSPQQVNNASMQMPKLELQDIHLPTPISDYPLAFGWWLLLALTIIIFFFVLRKYRQKRQNTKQQKLALQQLKPTLTVSETIALIKWAAIQYFPRQAVAQLYGDQFQEFLKSSLPAKEQQRFVDLSGDLFSLHYKNNDENLADEKFYQAAKLWLNQAIPAKFTKKSTKKIKENQGELT